MNKLQDLNDMAAFAKVVQTGGFTAAANFLGLPKSNISRRVSRLENELGVQLLERTTRRLHLTELGEIYFQHCRRILEEAGDAERSLTQMAESPQGLLKVGASVAVGQSFVSPLVGAFLQRYPEVNLQLNFVNRHIDVIEEGYDVAVLADLIEMPGILSRSLGVSAMSFYASHSYLNSHNSLTHPSDLKLHDLLLMKGLVDEQQLLLHGPEGEVNIVIRPRALFNDFGVLYQAVQDGAGIAILPDHNCVEKGLLVNVLPQWSVDPILFYACVPNGRSSIPKVKVFLDFFTEKFGS